MTRPLETDLWAIPRRNSSIGYLWAYRRGSAIPRTKHIQTRKSLLLRHCILIAYGKVCQYRRSSMFMQVHQILLSDPTDELLMIIGIFTHFFALETTLAERQFFRALAKLIGRRAARLSACGIAAIVGKMGYLDEGCSVGADGSLYNVRWFCSHVAFVCHPTNMLSNRNIPGLQIVCMKVCLTYLGRKDGMYFYRITEAHVDAFWRRQ